MTENQRQAMQEALDALEWIAAQKIGGLIQRKATEPLKMLRSALVEERASDSRHYDEAVEALRKAICALPRYSFLLNANGGVSRVEDRSGRWIDRDEAHNLFDPELVDWMLAKEQANAAVAKAKERSQ